MQFRFLLSWRSARCWYKSRIGALDTCDLPRCSFSLWRSETFLGLNFARCRGGRCGSLGDIWLAEWLRAVDFPLQSTREEGLSSLVEVVVEVPKWSFVKRSQNGIIDFVSPIPCLFNYGSVPIIPAPDGIPIFLLLLGPCCKNFGRIDAL